jgi:hypothetical protein
MYFMTKWLGRAWLRLAPTMAMVFTPFRISAIRVSA